ncbi:SUN domain-containing protein 1-like isoform X2 [Thalassophryne amazonica]|uniref:SUN domain-containing protein 1-like isoform X2 n=1 Tax=Thalassophryne amazonica TaxID=390379 RepID=UPI0014708BD2|nr:SUN domain-containing protein 1-like isoform X2 [Thalassophryne amazonica]
MQEQSNPRRMTMDFSQLHTYTPPQCAPENTGYTYSLSSSYSTTALEFEKHHNIAPVYESPRMSRRSLRLQTGAGGYGNVILDDSAQRHSSSSSYTSTRRETRTLRSRKQQPGSSSLSLSLSQTPTPRKTLSFSTVNTPISSSVQGSSSTSDSTMLTSNLDQSHLRQRSVTTTTVAGQWGRSSCIDHSSSVNGDASASGSKSHTEHINGYICKDCSFHCQRTNALTTNFSSSSSSALSSSSSRTTEASAAETSAAALSLSSPSAVIYSRDKHRRNKTGVLVNISKTCMRYSKRALAPVVSLFTVFFNSVLWMGSRAKNPPGKGVLASCSDLMRQAVTSSLSQLWLFKQTVFYKMGYRADGFEEQAHSSFCGSMNVKDLVTEHSSHLNLNGSLCDDCKGKQYSETHTVLLTQSSRRQRLMGALWRLLAYTGSCLLQPGYYVLRAGKTLGSGVVAATQKLLSLLWMVLSAPVKAGRGLFWLLATGWYQLVTFMSVLNVFFLTRCLPILWKLLLLLLPLLLLLALWWWGPSAGFLLAYLPAINLTMPASSPLPASVPVSDPQTLLKPTPASSFSQAPSVLPPAVASSFDMERLETLERQLAVLWERVQQGDQKQDQQHKNLLGLYSNLKEQLHTQTDRDKLGLWVSSLLEQRVSVLRGELEQENTLRTQAVEQQKEQQESQAARLAELSVLLNVLSTKTEEMKLKQQQYEHEKAERMKEGIISTSPPPSVSLGVKQDDHHALLADVQKIERELAEVKQNLQGVLGCKGHCEQLGMLRDTISAQVSSQVRKELHALFFGSDSSGEVPESLIHWLSQRYVSTSDLRASLASLEHSILRNMSLELSRAQTLSGSGSRAETIVQTVTGSVQQTAAAEGLTEEQVNVIVQNALKLYSQDRTGQVDYALESGGGSVLSTRCSETHGTKTALMSLFGLPLWYFSQSPRVVIQPDVYPGNCWAFKGSQGYLVIRLSMKILPTSFCVEHIPKTLSPTGKITSAPRNFTVFGLEDEYQEQGTLLGSYIYQEDGESLQTFPVVGNDKAFQIIEVRVLSNWGHPEYTCLYRFRVHGKPHPE